MLEGIAGASFCVARCCAYGERLRGGEAFERSRKYLVSCMCSCMRPLHGPNPITQKNLCANKNKMLERLLGWSYIVCVH
jgi:hypothetical protein